MVETITAKTPIRKDLKQHFIAAAAGSFIVSIIVMIFTTSVWAIGINMFFSFTGLLLLHHKLKRWESMGISFVSSIIISLGLWFYKEGWDAGILPWIWKKNPITGFSWEDIQADIIGIVFGLILAFALMMVVFPEDDPEPIPYIPMEEEKRKKIKMTDKTALIPTKPSTGEKSGKASIEAFSSILISIGTFVALKGRDANDLKTILIGIGIGGLGILCYFFREFKVKGLSFKKTPPKTEEKCLKSARSVILR